MKDTARAEAVEQKAAWCLFSLLLTEQCKWPWPGIQEACEQRSREFCRVRLSLSTLGQITTSFLNFLT